MADIVTVAELREWLNIPDGKKDAVLKAVVTSVTRKFENHCHRRFVAASETRYYTATAPYCLTLEPGFGGDLLSLSSLTTDEDDDGTYEVTWTTSDYALYPPNAAADGQPYSEIRTRSRGTRTFPVGAQLGVKLTGSFGLAASVAALPADLTKAALLECEKDFRATDAPLGVSGGGEFAVQLQTAGLHPFVRQQLAPYVVPTVV